MIVRTHSGSEERHYDRLVSETIVDIQIHTTVDIANGNTVNAAAVACVEHLAGTRDGGEFEGQLDRPAGLADADTEACQRWQCLADAVSAASASIQIHVLRGTIER